MRALLQAGLLALAALAGCGVENLVGSAIHKDFQRPASVIRGAAPWAGATISQITVTDADGNVLAPFQQSLENGQYELRLPSAKYAMLVVHARVGDMELRALVPSIGAESSVSGVDLDALNMTETLITEARLSADGVKLRTLTPATYVATRVLMRAGMTSAGPTQNLFLMVERLAAHFLANPTSGNPDPFLFRVPALDSTFATRTGSACGLPSGVACSAIDAGWIARNPFDYTGGGCPPSTTCSDSAVFDAALGAVAQLYRPAGCPDPNHIRLIFTVDFNQGALNGNCGVVDRFKWATDKPGKSMFLAAWIYTLDPPGASDITDQNSPGIAALFGNATPNVIPMYDDGTNGDESAGDGIWTVTFDVPRSSPGHLLRLGYKYTWGTFGAAWTGTEEWPGNGRLLEVVDVNGDGFVYRRDVFGDEATNKDFSNLNTSGTGSIGWTTALHGCGPEAHEQPFTLHNACACGSAWHTPTSVGPITIPCGP